MLPASLLKYKLLLTFSGATLLFLVSQWILFNGFNGADDLHYAMLSARMLKGQYNPFEPNDIYSGRILLISIQAFIYKVFGISALTTSGGTILATISACYLTLFNFLKIKKTHVIFILCCLFYFNPVLNQSIKGIMPDAYIMLIGVIILLFLKRSQKTGLNSKQKRALQISAGFIIAISLLLKETAIVFIPFTVIFFLIDNKKEWILNSLVVVTSFAIIILLFGVIYYRITDDPFFKIHQIKNSEYENSCNFSYQPFSLLLKRITFGAWQRFIVSGFYPIILGLIASIAILFERRRKYFFTSLNNIWYFITFLIIGLYFPFSLKSYEPLCDDPRHFLFLIPYAVAAFSTLLDNWPLSNKGKILFSTGITLILLFCIASTSNKWQWMIYSFLTIFSFAFLFKLPAKIIFLFLSFVLFSSIFERMFFLHNTWFQQIKKINTVVKSDHYYFINQDYMMHWKLLHNFDEENIHYFNLQNNTFKIFQLYNKRVDKEIFYPGWLILNKNHMTTSVEFITNINSSDHCKYYSKKIGEKDIYALLISKPEQLHLLQSLMK